MKKNKDEKYLPNRIVNVFIGSTIIISGILYLSLAILFIEYIFGGLIIGLGLIFIYLGISLKSFIAFRNKLTNK
jgi:hypothetical protein